jgi:hypothetical protein
MLEIWQVLFVRGNIATEECDNCSITGKRLAARDAYWLRTTAHTQERAVERPPGTRLQTIVPP